jgi:hypothetical protein
MVALRFSKQTRWDFSGGVFVLDEATKNGE